MIHEEEIEEILKLAENDSRKLAAKCIMLMQQVRQLKDEQIAVGRYLEEKTGKHAVLCYNYVKEEE